MDINTLLPVISKVIGKDVSREVSLFYRARAAVGSSLNKEGQEFFVARWPQLVDFMETPEGKKAIVAFMQAWVNTYVPPSIAAPEPTSVEEPPPLEIPPSV